MVERVVKRQAELGVDIVTDGEVVSLSNADFPFAQVGREGYYMHFLRHGVQGIDVTHLSDKVIAFSSQPLIAKNATFARLCGMAPLSGRCQL